MPATLGRVEGRALVETGIVPIRVGVADDHAIVRRALVELLDADDSMKVVGEASNGREAVELARTVPMDVLLLDIEMPGQSGFEAISRICSREKAPAVLMFSGYPFSSYGITAVSKGAAGYLGKGCELQDIRKAISVVAMGRKYFDEEVGSFLVETLQVRDKPPHCSLTDREFQIFLRLAQGTANAQTASDLSLTPQSVGSYRVRIMNKMRMRTNSELTYYAMKHRLIA